MKQKKFSVVIALLMNMVANVALAYDAEIDGIYYNLNATDKTATVTKGSGYSGDVVIPQIVNYNNQSYTVTSIGNSAFYCCSSLTSITVPNSVTVFGDWAFYCCSSLTSITIPNSVTSIGYQAFYGCSSLTNITIPNSVTSIEGHAFGYSGLTSITISNSVTSIGERAFSYCNNLTSVTSLIENPFLLKESVFTSNNSIVYSQATLYVPQGKKEVYAQTDGWKKFLNIKEIDPSGIGTVSRNGATPKEYYSLGGERMNGQQKGLNIIRMSDGTVRKVLSR